MIAVNGCGPTCLAMVYAGITKDTAMTPADIAEYCQIIIIIMMIQEHHGHL